MPPTEIEIPDKQYFRIGEVSTIADVEPHVLRYWETEFPKINPARSRAGQRLYRKRDIGVILKIKSLLYERKYTIAGAKRHLLEQHRESSAPEAGSRSITLEEVRKELKAIKDILSR